MVTYIIVTSCLRTAESLAWGYSWKPKVEIGSECRCTNNYGNTSVYPNHNMLWKLHWLPKSFLMQFSVLLSVKLFVAQGKVTWGTAWLQLSLLTCEIQQSGGALGSFHKIVLLLGSRGVSLFFALLEPHFLWGLNGLSLYVLPQDPKSLALPPSIGPDIGSPYVYCQTFE